MMRIMSAALRTSFKEHELRRAFQPLRHQVGVAVQYACESTVLNDGSHVRCFRWPIHRADLRVTRRLWSCRRWCIIAVTVAFSVISSLVQMRIP